MKEIAFIDHYDSFSDNLIDWLEQLGEYEIRRIFCDDHHALGDLVNIQRPAVFSPGPKSPESVPLSVDTMKSLAGNVPVLGICLGHQILGYSVGSIVGRINRPTHGETKMVTISSDFQSVFDSRVLKVGVYNSLSVKCVNNAQIEVVGLDQDGEIQIIKSKPSIGTWEAWGLQFHPESFLTDNLDIFGKYWMSLVDYFYGHSSYPAKSRIELMSSS